jgi:hypothetical protein
MKASREENERLRQSSVYERLIEIYKACNHVFKTDIAKRKRDSYHVMARACYFKCAFETVKDATLVEIASVVNRDHATALHAKKLLEWQYESSERFQAHYEQVLNKIELKEVNLEKLDDGRYKDYTSRLRQELTRLRIELQKTKKPVQVVSYNVELEPHEIKYRELPEEKKERYKVRVEAILKML